MSRIALVVPVLNQFKLAVDCIWSAGQQADAVFIQPAYRTGNSLAASWNAGIRQAREWECDVVVIANDDVVFGPDTLLGLSRQLRDHAPLVFANDVSEYLTVEDVLVGQGYAVGKGNVMYRWACFAIDPWLFTEAVGTFDENFSPAWWEDVDMEYRAHLLGVPFHQTNVPYYHYGHATTNAISARDQKSQAYFERKWGSSFRNNAEKFHTPYDRSDLTPKDWIRE